MLGQTVVAQRIVYEGIQKSGGPTNVEMTSDLLKSVRASHKKYKAASDEKASLQSQAQKKIVEKRKAALDFKDVVAKKKAAVSVMQSEISSYDTMIMSLQEKLRK